MEVVRIEAVERHPPAQALLGAWLDAPRPADSVDTYAFTVCGWALGREATVKIIQVLDGRRVVAEARPNRARPDVAESFGGAENMGTAGYEATVRAIELPPSFAIEVVAELSDGTRQRLATVHGRRQRMSLPGSPQLSPVMLTTIGRSGSKWLTRLLSCHPSVVAYQPLVFEPRVATYWGTVLRALSDPDSYLRQIHADRWEEPRWWLGDGAGPLPERIEPDMSAWLGVDAVQDLAAFCRERIEAFYLQIAERSGKHGVRYFAEKFLIDPGLLQLTMECFPQAREVILVRDFRDWLSSVFAWNEQQGEHGFGHEAQMSKAQYLSEYVLGDTQKLLERWRRRGEECQLVRYEDLVTEPRATLTALFEHLGIDSDSATVEAALELGTQPSEAFDSHRTISDPTQTIGRWRRDLPADFAEQCNEILGPVLDAFGYNIDSATVEMAG